MGFKIDIPQSTDKESLARFHEEITIYVRELETKLEYIKAIPDGLTPEEIITYLKGV